MSAITALALSHVPPGSPGWVYMLVAIGVSLHIAGGALAIPAGYVAVTAKKGERVHRIAGTVFFIAMLFMAGMGAAVGTILRQDGNIGAGILALYLVTTGWAAAKRGDYATGFFDKAGVILIAGIAATYLSWGIRGSLAPNGMFDGYGAVLYYVFGALATFITVIDFRVVARGGVGGERRIARHLWRMCTGFFLATGSFFLGQQKVMPAAWHGSPWLYLPALAPLAIMAYWLIRVRFKPWRTAAPAQA